MVSKSFSLKMDRIYIFIVVIMLLKMHDLPYNDDGMILYTTVSSFFYVESFA